MHGFALATVTAFIYTDVLLIYNWLSKLCSNLVRCQSCLHTLPCITTVLIVPYHKNLTFMLCTLAGASAAEENSGIVGNEPSASNACNGGKQSHHRATHAGQILSSCLSPEVLLQPKNSQLPSVTLTADSSPCTWRQVT